MIQSVDRLSLAQEIDRQGQKHGVQAKVLVQVSPAGEEQKGGMPPEAVRPFLEEIRRMPGLQVQGLMAVMPNTPDEAYLGGLFRDMRTLFEQLRDEALPGVSMQELSMGMSGDYLLAARHGATMVRLGSALMGPRNYGPIL
jgi:pyridoxal phosphate enzyme (YggS family)